MLRKGARFLHYVLPAVIKPLRVMWNQIIGFIFVVFAAWASVRTIRSFREFDGDAKSMIELIITLSFSLLMAGFGIYSFLRARKIARS